MEAQDYKKLNYNDYTSRSRSRSSTSTSTTMEETRKPLLPLQTQKLIKEVKALYYDAIGSYPSNFICRAIVEDIEKETYSMEELEYALQETAFAPRPAWAYTAAILKRIQEDKKRGDGFPF